MDKKEKQKSLDNPSEYERQLEIITREREKEFEQQLREKLDELRQRERHLEVMAREREKEFEQQLQEKLDELRERERHLEVMAREREKEFESRQIEKSEELRDRERHLEMMAREREKEFESRQIEKLEELRDKERHIEAMAAIKEKELKEAEESLQQLRVELEQEKQRYKEESKDRIEETATNYVQSAIDLLLKNKESFRKTSKVWMTLGSISLILAIVIALSFSVYSLDKALEMESINWPFLIYLATKGLIVVGLFGALSRYCFVLGKANMHESIKNSERIHAINFGKFYLESYGVAAKWEEIKDAFEHWNIESGSAFSDMKHDSIDVKSLESIGGLIDSLSKLPGRKENKT